MKLHLWELVLYCFTLLQQITNFIFSFCSHFWEKPQIYPTWLSVSYCQTRKAELDTKTQNICINFFIFLNPCPQFTPTQRKKFIWLKFVPKNCLNPPTNEYSEVRSLQNQTSLQLCAHNIFSLTKFSNDFPVKNDGLEKNLTLHVCNQDPIWYCSNII